MFYPIMYALCKGSGGGLPVVDLTSCVVGETITDEATIATLNKLYADEWAFIALLTSEDVMAVVMTKAMGMGFLGNIFGIRLTVSDGNWTLNAQV